MDKYYTQERKEYLKNYEKSHYKRIPLRITFEKYDEIKAHTSKTSESVNGFIKRAIDETMERDLQK